MKRIILTSIILIIFLLSGPVTKAQLSYIASGSATGNVITLPGGWTAGDLALVFAFRAGTNLYPSSPDFTEINRASRGGGIGGGAFGTLSFRILQTGDNSFTFTNATEIEVIVLRGSATMPVVQSNKNSGKSTVMAYAELVYPPLSSNWIVGFGGHQTATNVYQATASPMTMRSAATATKLGMHSLTEVSSFPQINWSTVNNNSNWITICAEIQENPVPMYFQSAASGDWRITGTWQQSDDGGLTWDSATRIPNSEDLAITILSGHTVYATTTISSYNNLTVDGTYEHRMNGGIIPTATWDINSTCLITGIIGTVPSGLNQNFGNFEWNCNSQGTNINFSDNLKSIQGTFKLTNTGTSFINAGGNPTFPYYIQTGGSLMMTNGTIARTFNITNDFSLSGGVITITNKNIAGTINVGGDFSMSEGTIIMSGSGGTGTLNVAGNFTHTGGTISETSTGTGNILFNGNGLQIYTSGGTVSNTIDFTVNSGSFLQMGTGTSPSLISNGSNGTFTLSSGATLGITSPEGITSTGSTGNIQVTGTRTYSTGANYIYNGSAAQNTGNGLPATVNSLTINITSGEVIINSALTITNDFSITTGSKANLGIFAHTSGSLTLGGSGRVGGVYGGTGSTGPGVIILTDYFSPASGYVTNNSPAGTWLGITSTDWNTGSNWSGGVPTSGTNAVISSSATNQPVISGELAVSNSVTINSGASLTVAPTGSATFTTLTNSGTLNLESDAGGIASLILTTYADNNGTENIELFLTGGGDTWHYISSPINGLPVINTFFTDNTDPTWDLAHFVENIPTSLFNNIPYSVQLSWVGYDGWSYYDGSTTSYEFLSTGLQLGKGYNYWNEIEKAYTLSGTINTSDPSLALTSTDRGDGNEALEGFNLLGNPFTCGLDIQGMFDNASWPSAINKAVYYTSNGSYYVYGNDVGVPATDQSQIPPMQGFFVQTSLSGAYSLPWVKVHTVEPRFKGEKTSIPLVRLSISTNGKSEETVVRFNEKAKTGIDMEFDAPRFLYNPNTPSIYTSLDGIDYTINGLPFPETAVEIPVAVKLLKNDKYTITAPELQGLDNFRVILTDKSTGTRVDLKSVKEYQFSGSTGLIKDRFVLSVSNLSTGIENPVNTENPFNTFSGFGMINIQPLSDEWDGKTGSIQVIDLSGKMVRNQEKTEFRKNTLIQLPSPGTDGLYFIEIRSGIMKYTGKVFVR